MICSKAKLSEEFHLSLLEALLITSHKAELCIQKQFYTPLLVNIPLDQMKKTLLPTPTLLAYVNRLSAFFPASDFIDGQYHMFASSDVNFVVTDIKIRDVTLFWILKYLSRFQSILLCTSFYK